MLNNVSNHKQKCSPLQQPKLWLHRVGLLIKKHVSKISNSSTGLFFWQVGRERKRVLGRRSAKGFNIFWQDMTSSNYMFVKMCYKSNRCCFYFPTWSANFFMAPKQNALETRLLTFLIQELFQVNIAYWIRLVFFALIFDVNQNTWNIFWFA